MFKGIDITDMTDSNLADSAIDIYLPSQKKIIKTPKNILNIKMSRFMYEQNVQLYSAKASCGPKLFSERV